MRCCGVGLILGAKLKKKWCFDNFGGFNKPMRFLKPHRFAMIHSFSTHSLLCYLKKIAIYLHIIFNQTLFFNFHLKIIMNQTLFFALIAISVASSASAQTIHQATVNVTTQSVSREVALQSNGGVLKSQLKPRSGANDKAQTPFIKYFWEYGDGNFSTDERPLHPYNTEGGQKVQLFMTPCYTLDKILPVTQTIQTNKSSIAYKSPNESWSGNLRMTSNLSLHNIKAVRANDAFVGIASLRNPLSDTRNAKLYIFYNKINQVKAVGKILNIKDSRIYRSTEGVFGTESSIVNTLKKDYYDVKVFNINSLDKTARNIFMTFEVLNKTGFEKIKDLDIVAAMVVDGSPNVEQNTLSFKTASSFDPNNIKAPGLMSFRFVENKPFKFRINFENIGNNPATSVQVKATVPDILEANSIKNIKMMPAFKNNLTRDSAMKYTISPDGKLITFAFSNIDISGTKEDWKPKKESSQGYIEYELKPKNGIRKRGFDSNAEIIFDNNTPIIADKDKTNFRNGLSIGVKVGMNYQPNTEGSNYFIGATYSAYRPAGIYLQMEAMVDLTKRIVERDTATSYVTKIPPDTQFGYFKADSFVFAEKYRRTNSIRLVPIHLRYDFSKFVSVGLGLNADVSFSTVQRFQTPSTIKYYRDFSTQFPTIIAEKCQYGRKQLSSITKTDIDYGIFGDIAFGNYSHGLSVGLRAMQPFKMGSATPISDISPSITAQPKPKISFQIYLSYKIL